MTRFFVKQLNLAIALVFLLTGCSGPDPGDDEYFGKFDSTVQAEWLEDGRRMRLLRDLTFTDANGLEWVAKKDRVVNGASIPEALWVFWGGSSPYVGRYRAASVVHDVYCEDEARRWESVHLMFHHAMRASNVESVKAGLMYAAVKQFGPRWPLRKEVLVVPPSQRSMHIPAQYETVTERVVETPASSRWIRSRDARPTDRVLGQRPTPGGGEEVRIEVPATYRSITKRVQINPARTATVEVPAVYETRTTEPPPKIMTREQFLELAAQIENAGARGDALSPEQIDSLAAALIE